MLSSSSTLGRSITELGISEAEREGTNAERDEQDPNLDGGKSASSAAWVMASSDVNEAIPVQAGFV